MKLTVTKADNQKSKELNDKCVAALSICNTCPTAVAFARTMKVNCSRVMCAYDRITIDYHSQRWMIPKALERKIRAFTTTRPRPLILGTFTIRKVRDES